MNNQFLQHLKSLTPEGKAEEKKIFIPADKFKPKTADKIDMGKVEQLDEATRSKYIKAYRRHKVGTDTTKLDIEDAKRNAAVLRRGGADDDTIRKGSFTGKTPMSHYNKVNMAKYRFGSKAARSMEDGKKSPRNVNEDMELDEATRSKYLKSLLASKGMFDTEGKERTHRKQLERRAAMLRRGGADPDVIRGEINRIAAQNRNDEKAFKPRDYRADTASYNFDKKSAISRADGKKSPRNVSEGSLGMKKGIRMSNAVINKGHTQIGQRAQSAELRSISKTNKEAGGTGRITTTPTKYKFSDKEYKVMQGHARKGISGKIRRNAVRAARMRGAMGGPEMNEGMTPNKPKKTFEKTPAAPQKQQKFAAGKYSHQMTPAEYQRYFGRPKPMSESKKVSQIKKKYKTGKKIAKRVIKKLGQALMTPQDAIDVMITGRNF